MPLLRFVLLPLAFLLVISTILLLSFGEWQNRYLWGYIGVWMAAVVAALIIIKPDLLKERVKPGKGAKGKFLQKIWMPLIGLHWVLAGLDAGRYHWSDCLPLPVQIGAIALMAAGLAFALSAVATNPFFSSVVRIQDDRGQYVVSTGPYAVVRHPAYLGAMLFALSSPFALNSLISAVPMLGYVVLLVFRTRMEDPLLHQSLPGYTEYAARVRYRLVPGIW